MEPHIAFVIPTNRPSLGLACAKRLISQTDEESDLVVLVIQGDPVASGDVDSRIKIVTTATRGATVARNVGIDYVVANYGHAYSYIFPNDQTVYSSESIRAARNFVVANSMSVGIGSWCMSDLDIHVKSKTPVGQTLSKEHAFLAYEPAVIFPGEVFARHRFDQSIGTGSASKAQSCEAPDLVLQSMNAGFLSRYVPEFIATNPSTTYQLTKAEARKKIYGYAVGSGVAYRKWQGDVGKTRSLLQILSPLAGFMIGRPYWRAMGLKMAFIASFGRMRGRFFTEQADNTEMNTWVISKMP